MLQLEEGLQTYGLLASIRANPTVWETVFVIGKGNPVTASSLIDSFDVKHSENQVKRENKADTFTYFCDFVHSVDMQGKLCPVSMNKYKSMKLIVEPQLSGACEMK